jgi:hypothetical protein
MKKYNYILIGAFLLVLLLAYLSLAESGCCLNPLAGDIYCEYDLLDVSLCCPSGDLSFYYSTTHPYGPKTEDECKRSPYFYPYSSCSANAASCIMGCCCNAQYGSKIQVTEKNRCDIEGGQFYSNTQDCQTKCNLPAPDIQTGDCQSAGYKPNLNLVVVPDKGKKSFTLSWSDTCNANEYKITRCLQTNCIEIGKTASRTFNDNSDALLWDTDYEYKVEGNYPAQGFISNDKKIKTSLGNLECWHQEGSNKFCLNTGYYNQYEDYLTSNYPDKYGQNFKNTIISLYGQKLNKAYTCKIDNTYSTPYLSCAADKICVVENGLPVCREASPCQPENLKASPFGMYFSQNECYNLGYCYFDTSRTIVDKCYKCSPQMACYDYKSQQACTDDNCHIGNCEWTPLISEFGIGVCKNQNSDNCQ